MPVKALELINGVVNVQKGYTARKKMYCAASFRTADPARGKQYEQARNLGNNTATDISVWHSATARSERFLNFVLQLQSRITCAEVGVVVKCLDQGAMPETIHITTYGKLGANLIGQVDPCGDCQRWLVPLRETDKSTPSPATKQRAATTQGHVYSRTPGNPNMTCTSPGPNPTVEMGRMLKWRLNDTLIARINSQP